MKFDRKKIGCIFRIIYVGAALIFLTRMMISYQARGVNEQLLKSDDHVKVKNHELYSLFEPMEKTGRTAFIFFPGAMVDPQAYVPLLRKIAAHGYPVYLVNMPWRMATYGYLRAKEIIDDNQKNQRWVLGGHSLGGKMAGQFAYEYPNHLRGLILIGTSHPRDISLANLPIPVTKIYATHDGLATAEKVQKNADKLPSATSFVRIEGGNHSQFGYYGFQLGDDEAAIGREEQHQLTLQGILQTLKNVDESP